MKKTTVMTFGTFDLFHLGHEFYITESLKLADTIIVVIARDSRVKKIKNIIAYDNEKTRLIKVQNFLDKLGDGNIAILGDEYDIFKPIEDFKPDFLSFGYDQNVPEDILKKKFPNTLTFRIKSYKPEEFKSSILRKNILK